MIIYGFGDTWPTTAPALLPQTNAEDDWLSQLLPVVQQTSGAGGAYDFFGTSPNPIQPVTITKRFRIVESAYADVDVTLGTLRQYLLAKGLSKLWFQLRGGTTASYRRWMWAKCQSVRAVETAKSKTWMDVEAVFYSKEGLWYGTDRTATLTSSGSPTTLTYSGNAMCPIEATVTAYTQPITNTMLETRFQAGAFFIVFSTVTYANSIAATKSLIIDSAAYTVTNDGADDYAGLTVGSSQVAWLFIPYNPDGLPVSVLPTVTQAGGGTFQVYLEYTDTYVY